MIVFGTAGVNNTAFGSSLADTIYGLSGNDRLYGLQSDETRYGGSELDVDLLRGVSDGEISG